MYKVYIIEDDPMVSSINERFINKLDNFKVIGKSLTGIDVLTKITSLNPDLILLDVFMPGLNGIELLEEIRRASIKVEIIMITAAQDVATITDALQLGVIDYLIKPYDFTRLKKALDSFATKVELIKDSKTLTQQDLDKIKNMNHSENNNITQSIDLPKGLDEITLSKILNIIITSEYPLSSSEVGDKLSVSRITARKYLEYLADKNSIQIHLKYGNTGRPTRLYQKNESR